MEPEYSGICPNCSTFSKHAKLKKTAGEYLDAVGKKVLGTVYTCQKCNYTIRYGRDGTEIFVKNDNKGMNFEGSKIASLSLSPNLDQEKEKRSTTFFTCKLNEIQESDKYSNLPKTYPEYKEPEQLTPISELATSVKPNLEHFEKPKENPKIYKSADNITIQIDWSKIIGYDEIKHIIEASLNTKNKKKTHILLCGSPGTSKTVFLLTIFESLKKIGLNAHYLDASTLSSSGVVEYMFSNDMDYCLLDELDKCKKEHQVLNTLETGILQETKHNKIRRKDMKNCLFVITANYQDKILQPLFTRMLTLLIPKYTKEQFYQIGVELLTKQYRKTKDIADYIVDRIWKIYTEIRHEKPNLRQCVQVAILTGNDKKMIEPILQGISTYSQHYEE